MTQPDTTTLSVRGEAERTVAPDFVQLHTRIRAINATKADAVRACAQAQRAVLVELDAAAVAPLTSP